MLVERHRVGTAFGLINMIQSLGLALANLAAGALNDHFGASRGHPEGYDAMLLMFAGLSLVGFICAALLWHRQRYLGEAGIEARHIAPPPSEAGSANFAQGNLEKA
jgi:MFS family permease